MKEEIKKEILDILDNITYWDTCPKEYKDRINKIKEQLILGDVSCSALSDAYHGGWRRSKKYAKETNFHGLNRKEVKEYFKNWFNEHYS